MTRDSKFWWVGMVGAIALAISSRWDLIDPLLPPQHTDKAHALIELISFIIGIGSGWMAASPLNKISDAGRKYYQDKADGL